MRKALFLTLMVASLSANAQFATYQSTTQYQQAQNAPTQTIYGYLATSKGWVRMSIRVKETDNAILVVGYKEKDTSTYGGAFATYGTSNAWRNCQAWAEPVSVYADGRDVASQFDCKVHISGLGTVYF